MFVCSFCKFFKKKWIIRFRTKYRLSIIAALDNVLRLSGDDKTG